MASNELLRLAYAAAKAMHFLLEELYRRDLWILAPEAISVSSLCKMHEAAAVCALCASPRPFPVHAKPPSLAPLAERDAVASDTVQMGHEPIGLCVPSR